MASASASGQADEGGVAVAALPARAIRDGHATAEMRTTRWRSWGRWIGSRQRRYPLDRRPAWTRPPVFSSEPRQEVVDGWVWVGARALVDGCIGRSTLPFLPLEVAAWQGHHPWTWLESWTSHVRPRESRSRSPSLSHGCTPRCEVAWRACTHARTLRSVGAVPCRARHRQVSRAPAPGGGVALYRLWCSTSTTITPPAAMAARGPPEQR